MQAIAHALIKQIHDARTLGQVILACSGLQSDRILYTFATSDVLVINCEDYEAVWEFDEHQAQLLEAISCVKPSIKTVIIECNGKLFYEW